MQFHYFAVNEQGQKSSGMIEAATEVEARTQLQKAGLSATKIEPSQNARERVATGPIFSFEFRGQKKSGQHVQGKIDAPDALTAETRLRSEFGLDHIAVWGKKEVVRKTAGRELDAAEAMLKEVLAHKQAAATGQAPRRRSLWKDCQSFVSWLLLIYAGFWAYAGLASNFSLGLDSEMARNLHQNPLFIWILLGLGSGFFLMEIPHFLKIWRRGNSLAQTFFAVTFPLLLILSVVQGWLLFDSTRGALSGLQASWLNLLYWPLGLGALIFVGSFYFVRRVERLYDYD